MTRPLESEVETLQAMVEQRERFFSREAANQFENELETAERRRQARRQAEIQRQWGEYHRAQAERLRRTMEPLIALHEARAAMLAPSVAETDTS